MQNRKLNASSFRYFSYKLSRIHVPVTQNDNLNSLRTQFTSYCQLTSLFMIFIKNPCVHYYGNKWHLILFYWLYIILIIGFFYFSVLSLTTPINGIESRMSSKDNFITFIEKVFIALKWKNISVNKKAFLSQFLLKYTSISLKNTCLLFDQGFPHWQLRKFQWVYIWRINFIVTTFPVSFFLLLFLLFKTLKVMTQFLGN